MLSRNPATLRLFVKSKRVPVGFAEFSRSTLIGPWAYSQSPVRAVLYEQVLDDSQARLVEEARQLSCSAGMDLEVIDLGRMSAIRRAFVSRFVGPHPTVISRDRIPASAISRASQALS